MPEGMLWVAHQHSNMVQEYGKHGSGAVAARALVKKNLCVTAELETSVLLSCLFEQ